MQLCDSKYISVNQFGFDKWFSNLTLSTRPQIGNRFALTAAHCLYSDDMEEVLPATSFSIMLGLHDRRKTKEPNRWMFCFTKGSLVCMFLSDPCAWAPIVGSLWQCFLTRRQIRVSKVFIHENFKESSNDIALLRLGKKF